VKKILAKRLKCALRLLPAIIISCQLSVAASYGQEYCYTPRFDTVDVFNNSQLDTFSVVFGQNLNWLGQMVTLKMTMVMPDSAFDSYDRRPLLVLIHGGGLFKSNRYEPIDDLFYFARKGYVCATIDYRLGWQTIAYPTYCLGDNHTHKDALYRGVQDTKAALRFLVANASLYRIDTGFIFIGGSSAGGFVSMATQFMSQADFNAVDTTMLPTMGSLDSASNTLTDTYTVKGILCIKGVLFDTSCMDLPEVTSVLFFHGTADAFYPYLTGHAYSCSNYLILQGAGEMYKRLKHLTRCYELNFRNGVGHELPAGEYMLHRKILFMKRILCNDCRELIIEDSVSIFDSQLITSVSANDGSQPFSADVYPNPANSQLTIEFGPAGATGSIEIFDLCGRMVHASASDGISVIDVSGLPGGIYYVRVLADKNVLTRKFIKE
jgi:poly(3-hydroxybutyrate) depolymerase